MQWAQLWLGLVCGFRVLGFGFGIAGLGLRFRPRDCLYCVLVWSCLALVCSCVGVFGLLVFVGFGGIGSGP